MQETELQEIIEQLIQRALKEDYTEKHLIDNWSEYKFYLQQQRSLRVVLRILRNSANFVFKTYCKEVAEGEADLNKLLAYVQLQEVVEFYEKDLSIVKAMNDEYDEYLGNLRNFVRAFIFGYSREE